MVNTKRAASRRPGNGAAPEPDAGPSRAEFHLESHVFFLFTQIFGRRNRQLADALRPLAITIPQWRVLAILHELPALSMNDLADLATVDRTTLTRALDNLVERGLVERRADARDRRSIRLSLTARGLAAFFRVLPRVVDQNERAVRGFSKAELDQLRAMLRRMADNLDGADGALGEAVSETRVRSRDRRPIRAMREA